MSSELLASGVDNLKGHLAGAFNVLTGSSGDYTDLGIGRKFGGATAAYSLRDVGAMNGPVVRVRRDSDNSEQDFSALAVPFISDWCNRQVVKPLDVRELNSGGSGNRDGDFVIAKAAYSLRSLGDRQATVAATGDTVARADGKYVVQVRRSSDDTIKSFTADEVTDGTLVAFVGSGNDGFVRTWYDQSVDGQTSPTANNNHAIQATADNQPKIVDSGSLNTAGGLLFDGSNDELSVSGEPVITAASSGTYSAFSVQTVAADGTEAGYLYGNASASNGSSLYASATKFTLTNKSAATLDNIARSAGQNLLSAVYNNGDAGLLVNGSGTMTDAGTYNFSAGSSDFVIGNRNGGTVAATFLAGTINEIIIHNSNQTDNRGAFEANIAEHYNISGVPAEDNQVNGFVETWYDQSGNGNNATQTTADNQPKIVENGNYLDEVKFDGTNDFLDLTSALGITNQAAIFTVAESGGGNDKIILDNRDGGTDGFRVFRFGDAFEYRWQSATVDTGTNPGSDTKFIGFANHDTSNASAAVNGATATAVSDTSSINVTATPRIGARSFTSAANFWDGTINELIVYGADQTSDRANIESNIANHYGITLS